MAVAAGAHIPGDAVPGTHEVAFMEARAGGRVDRAPLSDFIALVCDAMARQGGGAVDMPFLARGGEGELRVLLVGHMPVAVAHRKVAEGKPPFSSSRFAGEGASYGP